MPILSAHCIPSASIESDVSAAAVASLDSEWLLESSLDAPDPTRGCFSSMNPKLWSPAVIANGGSLQKFMSL